MKALDAKLAEPLQRGGASFSLSSRLYRAAFLVAWALLAAWTPPPMRAWRRLVLRLFGAQLHPTAIVYGSVRVWDPRNLTVGAYSALGPRVNCYCMAPIVIDSYVVVSQGAHLCAGTHDVEDEHFQLVARPISIGERAWIAAEAFVGPGVSVPEGTVLGARAVAFGKLEPWTIYAGNPAKPIKARKRPRDAGQAKPAEAP
jgi:putative colanic acid biosynthesis acetyltransferase WcaF